uniref:Uncharacterized protein n=1 Tax=Anopheles minimus TaxID=112268 RepID=A0A182VV32_9DIPT
MATLTSLVNVAAVRVLSSVSVPGVVETPGTSTIIEEDVPSICRKLRQFNITAQQTDEELESATNEALEKTMSMGLVHKNPNTDIYKLANKWFIPESSTLQLQLREVVQNMPEALNDRSDSDSEEVVTTAEQPSDCMGPGMGQRRSAAQIRAIAIYRRMREERERQEREAASRARKRRNSGSRSRSRTRRSNRSRSRSQRSRSKTRSRARSTPRNRRTSRSPRR